MGPACRYLACADDKGLSRAARGPFGAGLKQSNPLTAESRGITAEVPEVKQINNVLLLWGGNL